MAEQLEIDPIVQTMRIDLFNWYHAALRELATAQSIGMDGIVDFMFDENERLMDQMETEIKRALIAAGLARKEEDCQTVYDTIMTALENAIEAVQTQSFPTFEALQKAMEPWAHPRAS